MITLLPISVMLPLMGAGLTVMFRGLPFVARIMSITILAAQLICEAVMLVQIDVYGPFVMYLGGWAAPVGIVLVADRLAALLMVVSSLVTLAVLVYAISQQRDIDRPDGTVAAFHPAMLLMAAGVSNAFVAGDLFNLFVSFEILLTASYVLLTLGGTAERVRAGAPYLVVSIFSSIIFLTAIALIYAATGTVTIAELARRVDLLPDGTAPILQAMLLVAFGIKSAVWPMSAWLPDSYPNAPAPVTAVFAGLLTKVGIYAIIRTQTVIFGAEGSTNLLMTVALATMLIGILGAIAQSDIKRMLSFTLVSHIGYLLYGVALGSAAALGATTYYVIHHILVQTALFLAAGLVEHLRGTTDVTRLGGLARAAPLLAMLFAIPALNLAGFPPLSGFLGKVGLFQAGLADGSAMSITLVAGGALTSLLTLYAILRVWGRAFWRPTPAGGVHEDVSAPPATTWSQARTQVAERRHRDVLSDAVPTVELPPHLKLARRGRSRLPRGMALATAVIVAAGVALTIFGGAIYAFTERAGVDLASVQRYVEAVVGAP